MTMVLPVLDRYAPFLRKDDFRDLPLAGSGLSVLLERNCGGRDRVEDEFGVSSQFRLGDPFENFLEVGPADVDCMLEGFVFACGNGLIHDDNTGNVVEVKVDLCLVKYLKVSAGDWLLPCPLAVEVPVVCRSCGVPPLSGVELVQVDHRGPLA